MAEMDSDGNGQVKFDEFETWFTEHGGEMPTDTVPQWIAAIDDAMEEATGVRPQRDEFAGKAYGSAVADEPQEPEAPGVVVRVTLSEPGPLGYGFQDENGTVQIMSVKEGSQAARDGQVVVGSTLLSIEADGNVDDVDGLAYASVLDILKRGQRPLTLSFRLPPGAAVPCLRTGSHRRG